MRRTRTLLRQALSSLIREKPYEEIAVKEILDRANVGRSTFYTHFRDKDDLLVSSIHDMVDSISSQARRRSTLWHERLLWFSLPIFEYHYGHRHDAQLAVGTRARAIHRERLQEILCEMIADPVRSEFEGRRKSKAMPLDLLAEYIASTFVLVLDWWVQSKNPAAPPEIDAVFQSLVLPALSTLR